MEPNPFTPIKPAKGTRSTQSRKPFTREEVDRILTTMRGDKHYGYYYDFTYTLFSLALRPSEAIGLRWKYLDLVQGKVTICESLSRSTDGSQPDTLESGWTVPQAADYAGHSNNETVMKNYAHAISPPKPLEF